MINHSIFDMPRVKLIEERPPVPSLLEGTLFQPVQGYRFTEDALYLTGSIRPEPFENILEFGGGCGIIPLLLAKKFPSIRITSIELQAGLADCARRNVKRYCLDSQINILEEDARTAWKKFKNGSFQRVISNPPYREIGKGRLNPKDEKAVARHEISLNLNSIFEWSTVLLTPGGKINFIFPSSRHENVITLLEKNRFALIEMEEIKRVRNSVRIFHAAYKPYSPPIVIPINASREGQFK